MQKKRPRRNAFSQQDSMIVAAAQSIDAPWANESQLGAFGTPIDSAKLIIAAREDKTDRTLPGMIMQTAIWI
jgi:hypothetical protein